MSNSALKDKARQLGFAEPSRVSIGYQADADELDPNEGREVIAALTAGQMDLVREYLSVAESKSDDELRLRLGRMLLNLCCYSDRPELDAEGDCETVTWKLDSEKPVPCPDMVEDLMLLHRLGVLEPVGFQVDGLTRSS